MKPIKSSFPPGKIAVPTGLTPRYFEFLECLGSIEMPAGTIVHRESSCDITRNCNRLVASLSGDWIWFIDDDQTFEPNILMKLLAHAYGSNGQAIDIVMPLNVIKMPPYPPMIFHNLAQHGTPYRWDELSGSGLLPLPQGDMCGRAGMFVKRHVFESIPPPWFQCGRLMPGMLLEDSHFSLRLQQHGHTIWIDRDLVLDHITPAVVEARRDDAGLYRPQIVGTGYYYDRDRKRNLGKTRQEESNEGESKPQNLCIDSEQISKREIASRPARPRTHRARPRQTQSDRRYC